MGTPANLTVTCGHGAIKRSTSSTTWTDELDLPLPNVWLLTVGGASLPSAGGYGGRQHERNEQEVV